MVFIAPPRARTASIAAAAIAGALLGGCTPIDASFGGAVKADYAAQVVDPDPVVTSTGARPGGSGAQAQAAAERYRKGTVKQPVQIQTTSKTSSGSN